MNWRVKHYIGRTILGVVFAQSLFFHAPFGRAVGPSATAIALIALTVVLSMSLARPYAFLLRGHRDGLTTTAHVFFFAAMGIGLTFSFAMKAAPADAHAIQISATGRLSAGAQFLDFPAHTPLQYLVQFCDGVLLAFLLMLLVEWWGRGASRCGLVRQEPMRFGPLCYALPMLGVSLAMLLIFRPGIMTSDSMDQWAQATVDHYNDWHPFYHTLGIHALRKVWDSPSAIALFQASSLAFACGWLISNAQLATQAPRWAAWVAALLCAGCPVLALTSVTLWKDTAYAAAIVALTAAAISQVLLGKPDPTSPRGFLAILTIAVVAMLLRHNAPPAIAATITILAFIVPSRRWALVAAGTLSIVVFLILVGPLRRVLDIHHMDAKFALAAHHIAAHLATGEHPVRSEDVALIQQIDSSDAHWRYNCATVDPTIFHRNFNAALASQQSNELMGVWLRLAAAHPVTELKHIACVGSLVWSANGAPRADGRLYISSQGIWNDGGNLRWIATNTSGLAQDSVFPDIAQVLGQYLAEHQGNIVWRPGLYLLVLLAAEMVAVRRLGRMDIACASSTAVLAHSAALALLNVAQDARYQLPVYAACLALTPCLLLARAHPCPPRRESKDKPSASFPAAPSSRSPG